eukprot:SAG11_NODE_3944_length_2138_cov_1.329573_3_plen_326_part_00
MLTAQHAQAEAARVSLATRSVAAEERAKQAEAEAKQAEAEAELVRQKLEDASRVAAAGLTVPIAAAREGAAAGEGGWRDAVGVEEKADRREEVGEGGLAAWTAASVAAMGADQRFELLHQCLAGTSGSPSPRQCTALLSQCRVEAAALESCCATVSELLIKLESARISRLSAAHRDIDVADIMVLSNARYDTVSAQVGAALPRCASVAERTLWELLLDTTAQRRASNEYKWRLLKTTHEKERAHRATLTDGAGQPSASPSSAGTGTVVVGAAPSAAALAAVSRNQEMGFLFKRGANTGSWNKRWFSLSGHVLCCAHPSHLERPRL